MSDNRHIVDVIFMNLHVAALLWYNICIVLKIDQCRYFITVFNIIHKLWGWNENDWHIVDAIYTCSLSSLFIDRTDINFIDI